MAVRKAGILMQYDKDMVSAYRDLFLEVRTFLLSHEGIVETKKHRITTFSNIKGGLCHMRTMAYGVDVGFLKGAKMKDDKHLLSGSGKAMRVYKMKAFDQNSLDYYLRQAIALN